MRPQINLTVQTLPSNSQTLFTGYIWVFSYLENRSCVLIPHMILSCSKLSARLSVIVKIVEMWQLSHQINGIAIWWKFVNLCTFPRTHFSCIEWVNVYNIGALKLKMSNVGFRGIKHIMISKIIGGNKNSK